MYCTSWHALPVGPSCSQLSISHVQNAHWATHFLLWKFGIDSKDDPIGTGFGNWIKDRTERRSARPSMNGKTWRTQHDPWRGISRTAFGVDYLKPYPTSDLPRDQVNSRRDQHVRRMELNCFDDDSKSYVTCGFVQMDNMTSEGSDPNQTILCTVGMHMSRELGCISSVKKSLPCRLRTYPVLTKTWTLSTASIKGKSIAHAWHLWIMVYS